MFMLLHEHLNGKISPQGPALPLSSNPRRTPHLFTQYYVLGQTFWISQRVRIDRTGRSTINDFTYGY